MRLRLRPIKDFFQGAVLLMALVLVGLVSAVTTMHFAIHGAEVKVPALKQMTVAEARSQTSGLGLNLEVDNRYYSADLAAGHILSQRERIITADHDLVFTEQIDDKFQKADIVYQ